jgi:hypothetical protein
VDPASPHIIIIIIFCRFACFGSHQVEGKVNMETNTIDLALPSWGPTIVLRFCSTPGEHGKIASSPFIQPRSRHQIHNSFPSSCAQQLSNWVSKQRHDFKLRRRGTSMRLTDVRYKKLSDLGFVWDANGNELVLSPLDGTPVPSNTSNGMENGSSKSADTVMDQGHGGSNPHSQFPSAYHNRNQTGEVIDLNQIEATLNAKAVMDPHALLEAAKINSWRLQTSGLAPTGKIGNSSHLAPGELMAMALSLPVTTQLVFVPVLRTEPALHMPAAPYGMAEMYRMMPHARTGSITRGAMLAQGFRPHPPLGSNTRRGETLPDHWIQAQEASMENRRPARARGVPDHLVRNQDVDERRGRGGRRADPPGN